MDKVKQGLLAISVGQYTPQLYFKGKQYQSSVCGGLFTIAYQIFFFTATIFILVDVLSLKHFSLQSETFDFNNSFRCKNNQNCQSITIDQYFTGISQNVLFITIPGFNGDCQELNMTATINMQLVSAGSDEIYSINETKRFNTTYGRCYLNFFNFSSIKSQIRDKSDEVYIGKLSNEDDSIAFKADIVVNGHNGSDSTYIRYEKNNYLDSGPTPIKEASNLVMLNTINYIELTLTVVDYIEYKSLSSVFYRNIPDYRTIFFNTESIRAGNVSYADQGQLKITPAVLRKGVKYTRFPQNIFSAFPKKHP